MSSGRPPEPVIMTWVVWVCAPHALRASRKSALHRNTTSHETRIVVPGAACSAAYGKILTCPARANRTRSTNHWAFTGGSRTGQRPFVGDCELVYAGGRERVERHSLPAGGGGDPSSRFPRSVSDELSHPPTSNVAGDVLMNGRNLFHPNPLPARHSDRMVFSFIARQKTTFYDRDPAVASLSLYGVFHRRLVW
jgi:hypothetical protein